MSIQELYWVVFALFTGGVIKGTSGIGLPMIAVPLMAFVLPLEFAAALLSFPILLANLVQVRTLPAKALKQPWLLLLAASLLVGLGVGSLLITEHSSLLLILTGLSVCLFAILSLAGIQPTIRPTLRTPVALLSGSFAGLTGGSTAMYGWPLVMYLSSVSLSRSQFISTVSLLYLLAHSLFLLIILLNGLLTPELLMLSSLACIPVFAGVKAGTHLGSRLAMGTGFQRLVSLLMLAGGVSLMLKA